MHGPYNHYVCERCESITIAKDEDEGTTPFMIPCRATPGCEGTASSTFYRGPQDATQVPHVVFYKPKDEAAMRDALRKEHRRHHDAIREHVALGGLLMRDGPAAVPEGE